MVLQTVPLIIPWVSGLNGQVAPRVAEMEQNGDLANVKKVVMEVQSVLKQQLLKKPNFAI